MSGTGFHSGKEQRRQASSLQSMQGRKCQDCLLKEMELSHIKVAREIASQAAQELITG